MRTIKFRGRIHSGTIWAYGFIEMLRFDDGTWHYYIREYKQNGGYTDYEVDHNTIGQFTGLYDKNGKEIYEGDIVITAGNNFTYQVIYNEKSAAFIGKRNSRVFDLLDLYESDADCREVIGNIHDNPLPKNETIR